MRRPRMTIRGLMIATALAAVVASGFAYYRSQMIDTRERVRRLACASNLRLLALAAHYYDSAYGHFPPGTLGDPGLPPDRRLSWATTVFEFFGQGLRLLTDASQPWDAPANLAPLVRQTSTDRGAPPVTSSARDCGNYFLQCPSHGLTVASKAPSPLGYLGIAGLGPDAATLPSGHPRAGFFGYDRVIRNADVKDGTSTTMMLAESATPSGPWTAGGPATLRGVDPARRPYLGPGRPFGGSHPGGANVALVDGTVRFVRETIDPKVFEALSTIAGGETLTAAWGQ